MTHVYLASHGTLFLEYPTYLTDVGVVKIDGIRSNQTNKLILFPARFCKAIYTSLLIEISRLECLVLSCVSLSVGLIERLILMPYSKRSSFVRPKSSPRRAPVSKASNTKILNSSS